MADYAAGRNFKIVVADIEMISAKLNSLSHTKIDFFFEREEEGKIFSTKVNFASPLFQFLVKSESERRLKKTTKTSEPDDMVRISKVTPLRYLSFL